jgi:hypothetical protein
MLKFKIPTEENNRISGVVGPLRACVFLLGLGATTLAAEDRHIRASTPSATTAKSDDEGKPAEPAECPIRKTIGGKTYCFQNDPALTKPQGGY